MEKSPAKTKAEKLLLTAMELEQKGMCPFSAEDLVVAAWRRYPDTFALEGYPEHPDSNRIYAEIMGSKSLRQRAWIIKVGQKRYQLTEAGLLAAKSLVVGRDSVEASRADLSREQRVLLERLMSSRAVQKMKSDDAESIIFPDACAFWDISPRSVAKTLQARLQTVDAVMTAASAIIQQKDALVFVHGGALISANDIQLLRDAHNLLLERFDAELGVIRSRKDERVVR